MRSHFAVSRMDTQRSDVHRKVVRIFIDTAISYAPYTIRLNQEVSIFVRPYITTKTDSGPQGITKCCVAIAMMANCSQAGGFLSVGAQVVYDLVLWLWFRGLCTAPGMDQQPNRMPHCPRPWTRVTKASCPPGCSTMPLGFW